MNKIEFGDCRDTMRRWAAEGVKLQTCMTSPPYLGLRDYGPLQQERISTDVKKSKKVHVERCTKTFDLFEEAYEL